MSTQVFIEPSKHQFICNPDQTILNAALDAKLILPYGCKNGACGSCKGRIIDGQVDYGVHQPETLTEAEKMAGKALFCVAKPLSDTLTIEVREVREAGDIQVKKLPCRVEELIRAAPDVMIVRLKLPSTERFQFLPGQYIDFLLKDGKRRSFSIATAPHDDGLLELHIRHLPGGLFTDPVFNTWKGKEIQRFEGPLGSFFLRDDSDKPIILVAGGTGFAPMKSIIEHALHHGLTRPMVLYWGARTLTDLYLGELAASYQSREPNFTFIPVLSEPGSDSIWPGRTGLVHQAVLADFRDLSGYQVYVCGAPAMVNAARADFTGLRGLPENEFFADSFEIAAMSDAS